MQVDEILLAESGWLGEAQALAPAKCTQDPRFHYLFLPAAMLRAPVILSLILTEFRACLFRQIGRFRYRERTHLPSFQSLGAVEVAFVSQEDACWFAGMQHGIQAEAPFA